MKQIIAAVVLSLTSTLSFAATIDFETATYAEDYFFEAGLEFSGSFAVYANSFRFGATPEYSEVRPFALIDTKIGNCATSYCENAVAGQFFSGADVNTAGDLGGNFIYEISRLDGQSFNLNSLSL